MYAFKLQAGACKDTVKLRSGIDRLSRNRQGTQDGGLLGKSNTSSCIRRLPAVRPQNSVSVIPFQRFNKFEFTLYTWALSC